MPRTDAIPTAHCPESKAAPCDTWADPGRQTPPAAWQGLSGAVLADSVGAYTAHVIDRFEAEGIPLRYVQIGNEIDGGMLWDHGRVGWPGSEWDTPAQWAAFTQILQAGAGAVRGGLSAGADTELILHVATGGDNARCRWFHDEIAAAGVDFDVIGLSFYPWWHGSLWQLETNLRDLGPRYGKPVMVVETAYPWTVDGADATDNFVWSGTTLPAGYPASPLGQRDFLGDVRRVVETAGGRGVIYWEPSFIPLAGGPPNPYENLTLFDFEGGSLPGLSFGAVGSSVAAVDIPPQALDLAQNQPNPFNPATVIAYSLGRDDPVSLKVFDLEGRLVRVLVDTTETAGRHEARWTALDQTGQPVASEIYLYELKTVEGVQRRKMVLVR